MPELIRASIVTFEPGATLVLADVTVRAVVDFVDDPPQPARPLAIPANRRNVRSFILRRRFGMISMSRPARLSVPEAVKNNFDLLLEAVAAVVPGATVVKVMVPDAPGFRVAVLQETPAGRVPQLMETAVL